MNDQNVKIYPSYTVVCIRQWFKLRSYDWQYVDFNVQLFLFKEHLMQRDRLLQNKIHQAFRRSEHQLLKALEARKAEVKVSDKITDFFEFGL